MSFLWGLICHRFIINPQHKKSKHKNIKLLMFPKKILVDMTMHGFEKLTKPDLIFFAKTFREEQL